MLQWILKIFSGAILKKYHPKIIGITGSVGKTSAKEAIFCVVREKFKVRRSIKNYNNELGVPLTIIGEESGGKNPFIWLKIFCRAFCLLVKEDKNYPEVLILEMGADKPGDIKYLTDLAPCDIGVLTAIGPTHLEKFKTVKKVAEEKQIIIKHLLTGGVAIINHDDDLARAAAEKIKASILSFGFNEGADLRGSDMKVMQEMDNGLSVIRGETFKLSHKGSVLPVQLEGVVGRQAAYAGLCAAAVGVAMRINLMEIVKALKKFVSPPSRMRIVPGIKYTTLIDDSYNSSPKAVERALEVLQEIVIEPGARKFAVLGDMLELGSYTEEAHRLIGKKVAEGRVEFLVTVGERAKLIAEAAKENGLGDDQIAKFSKSEEAGLFLQEKIQIGDAVLIKGSQGVRMERVVVELMAEPLYAKESVCRQDTTWQI